MMLALKRTNITATWTNASVKILINLSLVKLLSIDSLSESKFILKVILLYLQELLTN